MVLSLVGSSGFYGGSKMREHPIRIYDTMTRRKRQFKPLNPPEVTMYVCGPTVYGEPHIGNLRTFTSGDLIRRWLTRRGYRVKYVMNITDIEDKTIRDSGEKEAAQASALGKKAPPEELSRGIFFESPWGRGRPGWHIECSAMSRELLGETIDIHAGGEDLVFPHHENEVAQSESLTGKQFVRFWLHMRFLKVGGRRMGKSLGNYVSFDKILEKHSPEALRYFYISTQYRRPLDFTWQAKEAAEHTVRRRENTVG